MSLLESLQSLSLCKSNSERPYYYLKFQNDIQVIFDDISASKDIARVNINIMKGSIYLKGDYFIPLKSNETFQLNCQELLEKLKNFSSVLSVEVDSNFNLVLCVKRTAVYQTTLGQISEFSSDYGMFAKKKSVLILIDTDELKSYNSLRNTLLAEHIISILAANKVEVFYSEDRCDSSCRYPNCTKLVCSNSCSSLTDICKELELKINNSKWKTDSEIIDSLCIDAEKYIKENSLQKKYGKIISRITLLKNNAQNDLYRTAFIKHLLTDHMTRTPDFILHIGSQSRSVQIYKSGMLLEMLEELTSAQVYIFNQNVHFKDENELSTDDFVLAYRSEVEKAMEHKYGEFTSTDETWVKRIESLVDSAVKFEFLKVNHNSILNLRRPSSQSGGKSCGIFVQYNFARLSNLFRNFEAKVKENYYQPLQSLEEVDFNLLKLEEEWNLFHFVLSFPQVVKTLLESLLSEENRKSRFYFNKICIMLQDLCRYLSLYYSKIRILSGPQVHLQKTMNARLWLLKGIHQVFENSFSLLNVNGLDLM
ncbi:DALR anticodon-binding domain-containing protein 3 [Araneus ventricosus]|uniref:DALR anticodon-binding domain-containing protein 3 n=1 Tax=Araneus ventricosus TaxID=182803 RepID=A0A4Y2N3D5_ARAVE|nr:DALR anticodon-binding domain-containing protein 3 [Araneus ventricosus]